MYRRRYSRRLHPRPHGGAWSYRDRHSSAKFLNDLSRGPPETVYGRRAGPTHLHCGRHIRERRKSFDIVDHCLMHVNVVVGIFRQAIQPVPAVGAVDVFRTCMQGTYGRLDTDRLEASDRNAGAEQEGAGCKFLASPAMPAIDPPRGFFRNAISYSRSTTTSAGL